MITSRQILKTQREIWLQNVVNLLKPRDAKFFCMVITTLYKGNRKGVDVFYLTIAVSGFMTHLQSRFFIPWIKGQERNTLIVVKYTSTSISYRLEV